MNPEEIHIRATLDPMKDTGVISRFFFSVVQRILGENLYVGIPTAFVSLPSGTHYRRALILAKKISQLGWCKEIVRNVPLPDEPFLYSYSAHPQETSASGGWGADFFDETKALKRTLSEFIERFLWQTRRVSKSSTRTATIEEMQNVAAFPLEKLAGYSPEQKKKSLFLDTTPHDSFTWIPVISLLRRRKRWAPLQLISGAHFNTVCIKSPTEKLLRESTTNGLATSWNSRSEAILRGLLELIERDAFAVLWTRGITPTRIAIPNDKEVSRRLRRADLEVVYLSLPTDFPVHVIAAAVLDTTKKGPAFALGMKASFDLEKAAEGSLREALSLRHELRDGSLWNKKAKPLKECSTRIDRLVAWSQPENLAHVDFLFNGEEVPFKKTIEKYSVKEQLSLLKKIMEVKGYSPFFYEHTHSLQKNLHTVSVIVPELMPLQIGMDIPYYGGERLESIPKELNLQTSQKINPLPHPFA
jgi:thiazole/oxazole-forming peptide maturase SagD family component